MTISHDPEPASKAHPSRQIPGSSRPGPGSSTSGITSTRSSPSATAGWRCVATTAPGRPKPLEVLFPFVLDGGLDARRLDPFSGENRTMKANLLYRGQDAEHGYVWMEFGRPTEPANPAGAADSRDPPTHGGASGDRAPGDRHPGHRPDRAQELGAGPPLVLHHRASGWASTSACCRRDSRPLTAKQLTVILGRDASFGDRRGAYQDAVDARLFGLGRERYTQLLDLLIALRRPLLAKDLDPVKVSGDAVRRPQPGRRRPGRAGRPGLREPGRRPEAVRRPGRRRRGGPRLPRPSTPPTSGPTPGTRPTRSRPGCTPPPGTSERSSPRSTKRPRPDGRNSGRRKPGNRPGSASTPSAPGSRR